MKRMEVEFDDDLARSDLSRQPTCSGFVGVGRRVQGELLVDGFKNPWHDELDSPSPRERRGSSIVSKTRPPERAFRALTAALRYNRGRR